MIINAVTLMSEAGKRKSIVIIFLFVITIKIPVHSDSTSSFVVTATIADKENSLSIDTTQLSLRLIPTGTYTTTRDTVIFNKQQLNSAFIKRTYSETARYDLVKKTLEECIINKLIPFWYGTPWDFNGYTQTPNKGLIACGYFVSTVLLHAGFSLNRYTLAQQDPYHEAVSIQLDDSIKIYSNGFTDFYQNFKSKNGDGLYFAGLDCHVGFLLYRNGVLLFIHSSYIDPLCVTIEIAEKSPAFTASRTYNIAEISTNKKLLDYWLNDKKIIIRTK